MKLLLFAIAATVAITSPALAATKKHVPPGVYGSAVVPNARSERSPSNPSWNVYGPSGRYIGSDPDPRVRLEMDKDAWGGRF